MKGKSGMIRPKRNRSVNKLVPTVAMMKMVLERHLRPHGLVFDIPIVVCLAFATIWGEGIQREWRGEGFLLLHNTCMTQAKHS